MGFLSLEGLPRSPLYWALSVGEVDEQDLSDIMIKLPKEYQAQWHTEEIAVSYWRFWADLYSHDSGQFLATPVTQLHHHLKVDPRGTKDTLR